MKRTIMVLILLTILLSHTAFAQYDDEIMFRDIEWRTPASVVADEILPDVRWGILNLQSDTSSIEDDLLGDINSVKHYHGKISALYKSLYPKGIKVAGYYVESLSLQFVLIPENDTFVYDEDHLALYFACYEIKPSDFEIVFEDLTRKLYSKYGPDYEEKEFRGYATKVYRIWKGANDTCVSLVSKKYPNGTGGIWINYGFLGSRQLLDNALQTYVLLEQERVSDNTDGL